HLPDLTAFVPIFDGERRLLWTIVRAHQSDIGGGTHGGYNPAAREIYQEGIRIPPVKLYEAGRPRDDLLDLLALNVRNPREFRGDLAAMLGAAHLGERRLSKLFAEFGAPTVEAAIEAILDAAEQQARAVVSTWKDGVFHGEAFLDDDGHGRSDIRIAAKVTKKGTVGIMPRACDGRLGPSLSDRDSGRRSALRPQFHLAHVPGPARRRRVVRR